MILVGGTSFTALLSTAILGTESGGLPGISSGLPGALMSGGGFSGGFGAYATAAAFGGGIVYAAALTLPGLVYLRGASSVYLRAIEGLDLVAEQEALRERVAGAQARAREFQAQAQATAQQYAQRAHAPAVAVPAAAVFNGAGPVVITSAASPGCPVCLAAIVPGDVFCANCGHKLA
jgi:hypothetical protein